MNEFQFGVSRERLSKHERKRYERIAARHGVDFMEANTPWYQRWFVAPNRGEPFDRQLMAAVYADLETGENL